MEGISLFFLQTLWTLAMLALTAGMPRAILGLLVPLGSSSPSSLLSRSAFQAISFCALTHGEAVLSKCAWLEWKTIWVPTDMLLCSVKSPKRCC